jgi:hypothetical protein
MTWHRECPRALKSNSIRRGGAISNRGWKRRFDEPIPTPKGKPLVTLKDAAAYIVALPKKEAGTAEWQAAIEALMLVATSGGPRPCSRASASCER